MNHHLKVCGMKYLENVNAVVVLQPDFMGFIFDDRSKRFMRETLSSECVRSLNQQTKTVGVFVNADVDVVLRTAESYHLSYAQLHGNESPAYCDEVAKSLPIIKAFGMDDQFDFKVLQDYTSCSYFLFDNKSRHHGGSGQKFDWNLLENYKGTTPFFLSGGIAVDDVESIQSFHHPRLFALDINSRFETEPGYKDIALITSFMEKLNRP